MGSGRPLCDRCQGEVIRMARPARRVVGAAEGGAPGCPQPCSLEVRGGEVEATRTDQRSLNARLPFLLLPSAQQKSPFCFPF